MEPILFKTDNCYLYSPNRNEFLLINPALYEIIEKKKKGVSDYELLKQITENYNPNHSLVIDNNHYLNHYYFLKEEGYFEAFNVEKKICRRYSAEEIEVALTNTNLIIFEITEQCNLDCKYCTYGELYNNYDPRNNRNLDYEMARDFLDSFISMKNSYLNKSFKKKTRINFYGGEPLMNIKLIKQIVEFVKEKEVRELFDFGMTTNGTYLKKHIDYLVEEGFDLVVSLDGDAECNSYRIFKNGEPTFNTVLENLVYVKINYPNYFEKHVSFNSVFNNKSTIEKVYTFFKSKFKTKSMLVELDPNGINPSKRKEFDKINNLIYKDVDKLPDDSHIIKELQFDNTYANELRTIFLNCLYTDTLSGLLSSDAVSRIPTATCIPFSRSIHITVNGNLFLCERTGHDVCLGNLSKSINIDFNAIANIINKRFDDLEKQCSNCYMVNWCEQCAMVISSVKGQVKCPSFASDRSISKYLSKLFTSFEQNPELYLETLLNN